MKMSFKQYMADPKAAEVYDTVRRVKDRIDEIKRKQPTNRYMYMPIQIRSPQAYDAVVAYLDTLAPQRPATTHTKQWNIRNDLQVVMSTMPEGKLGQLNVIRLSTPVK